MSWVNSKAFIGIFSQTAGSTCEFWVNPVNFTFGLKKPTLFNGKRLTALLLGLGALAGLEELCLWGNTGRAALPAGLGRLRNLEELDLYKCPGLADLHDLERREGLPALLAHLASQGEPAPAAAQRGLADGPTVTARARGGILCARQSEREWQRSR
jgi:hypothetical protein